MFDHAQNDAAFVVGHIVLLRRLPVLKTRMEIGRRIHIFALIMSADLANRIGDPLVRLRPALEGPIMVHPAGRGQACVAAVAVDVGEGVARGEIPCRGVAIPVVPDHSAGEVPVFVFRYNVLDAVEPKNCSVAFVLVIHAAGIDLIADNMVLMVADLQNDPTAGIRRDPPWAIEKQTNLILFALDAGHDAELTEASPLAYQNHPAFVFSHIVGDFAPKWRRHIDKKRVAVEVLRGDLAPQAGISKIERD